jgi:radical SAM superfamily enzyme YgiQ (UPF0313 family)
MPKESMPLAAGYLKAAALQSEAVRDEFDIRILNFGGGDSVTFIAETMFSEGLPDVLAFSVLGWSYFTFGNIAEGYKQVRPDGCVVFGGTHVANQADRTFRQFPDVDVVVNGEGEFVFRDILLALLGGGSVNELHGIEGISFREPDGSVVTTKDAERILDLDLIPSPFLTNAIPLTDPVGDFRYDVALMETNRGCPYRCAFCFWGGAVGQKVRAFDRGRLREELEIFAFHKVHTIVLCDANIGLLREDLEFVEDVIRLREKYGYPRAVEGSWAKNKSKVFFDIVRRMKEVSMRSSFTLALQTLEDTALEQMQRRNMKVNQWEDLVRWLRDEGLDCYAELIWGAPGETVDSFYEGYDRLATYMTRIAVYPLLLLPNTDYSIHKERYGFQTVRGENDDFEYVLAHNTMTIAENLRMKRFILWARSIAEHLVFRQIWAPLRELAGLTQSVVIRNMVSWFETSAHPVAVRLAAVAAKVERVPSAVPVFLRQFYGEPTIDDVLTAWWRESMFPLLPAEHAELLTEIFRFDCLTRPVFDLPGLEGARLPVVKVDDEPHYCRSGVTFRYDIPAILPELGRGPSGAAVPPVETELTIYSKVGFHQCYASHEEGFYYVGRTEDELLQEGGVIRPYDDTDALER